jgi:methylglutaconyl-CoA hydratase
MDNLVLYKVENRVAWITLNRPEKRNALNPELITELTRGYKQAEDDDAVKVIVLKAEGGIFSAGADLAYLQQLQNNSHEENIADSERLKELFTSIYNNSKITIAQVEGHAIAGGCGLATVCDFVFAVPEAKFGYTEVKIGFIPALVAAFLVRKIGEGRAKELLLSGNLINAQTAGSYGLINFVADKSEIAEKVKVYAEELCQGTSAGSIRLTKQLLIDIENQSLTQALNTAVFANANARKTADFKRGIGGFLKGEKLSW